MKKVVLAVIASIALLAVDAWAQVGGPTPSSIPVRDLAESGVPAENILRDLAAKYHVVIGVYGTMIGRDRLRRISIKVKKGTLKQVFDAITRADPRLEWRETANGSVHFVTWRSPASFMEVILHSFDYQNPQQEQVTYYLTTLPEIHRWLKDNKCIGWDRNTVIIAGGRPQPWGKFSVHASDLPLPMILDEIAAKSQAYFWAAIQYSTDPCGVDIQWGDVQSKSAGDAP
ncbi:MAG: hypothetical protein ACLP6G_10385 [Terriglobales bacterium]